MQFARSVLGRLCLSSLALAGAASLAEAQQGDPTYKDIVIVGFDRADDGTWYDLDTDGDGVGDKWIFDLRDECVDELWDEMLHEDVRTDIWLEGPYPYIVDIRQY